VIFIVRASFDADGQLCGVVTLTRTGRKEQFAGAARLSDVISAMAGRREQSGETGLAQLDEDPAG
jgi:hypothetical protein